MHINPAVLCGLESVTLRKRQETAGSGRVKNNKICVGSDKKGIEGKVREARLRSYVHALRGD